MTDIFRSTFVGLFCIGITILVVIGVVVLLAKNRAGSRASKMPNPGWPAVTGRIVAARVEEAARFRPEDDVFFQVVVEFSCPVGGQVYTGRQAVGRPSNFEPGARQNLAYYPVGAEIFVYYNPQNPGQARLMV